MALLSLDEVRAGKPRVLSPWLADVAS